MDRNLMQAAKHLGTTRPKLIAMMRDKNLLNAARLPAFPTRDREYLSVRKGQWFHPVHGLQYTESVRIKQAGIRWLAEQLDIELPPIPADHRDVA